jgi:TRAP-type C4-dicarboxylate transport system permease small subunit
MNLLNKLDKALTAAAKWTSIVLFAVMVLLSILQVICRYVLHVSLSFTEELARFLFIWVTFLGSAMALKKDQHVKMDLLVRQFPEIAQKAVRFVLFLVSLIAYWILIYYGFVLVKKTVYQTSAALGLPMSYIYFAVPVCGILMAFFECTVVAKQFAKKEEVVK